MNDLSKRLLIKLLEELRDKADSRREECLAQGKGHYMYEYHMYHKGKWALAQDLLEVLDDE